MNFSLILTYIKIRGDDMYPNPYMMTTVAKTGLLSKGISSLKAINWSGLLEGTQKTLGVINQAIPVVYQIKPIVNNAKTIFKIANSMKEEPQESTKQKEEPPLQKEVNIQQQEKTSSNNSPIFYI